MRIIFTLAACVALIACGSDTPKQTSHNHSESPQAAASMPAHFESEAAAQPLTPTLPPDRYPVQIAKAYAIAKNIPAVLAQQPCYCYCDRTAGHKSLLDCFKDEHGAECGVCRKEAILADRMTRMGMSAKEIRSAIVRGDWKQVSE